MACIKKLAKHGITSDMNKQSALYIENKNTLFRHIRETFND